MTQPLVLPGTPGRRVFVSQMVVDSPPRTQCRLVVATMQLLYAGLAIPDKRRFIAVLRKATGVPELTPAGASQGTTAADLMRGMAAIVPWVYVEARTMDDTELLRGLASGAFTAGVAVPRYNGLPGKLSRWSPSFSGGHAIALLSARDIDGDPMVLWVDPLGRRPYTGEWVRLALVKPHLSRGIPSGRIFATTIAKEAGLGTQITVERAFTQPAAVTVPKGTTIWGVVPESLDVRRTGVAPAKQASTTLGISRIRTRPARPPQGRFVLLATGDLTGRYVAVDDVHLTEAAPGDPTDIEAIRAAAFAEGRAAAEAEFEGATDVYRRVQQ